MEAVAIPRAVFDDHSARSPEFRSFVLKACSRRITDLFRVIDEVASGPIDMRLAQRPSSMAAEALGVKATRRRARHGTAREVILLQLRLDRPVARHDRGLGS